MYNNTGTHSAGIPTTYTVSYTLTKRGKPIQMADLHLLGDQLKAENHIVDHADYAPLKDVRRDIPIEPIRLEEQDVTRAILKIRTGNPQSVSHTLSSRGFAVIKSTLESNVQTRKGHYRGLQIQ